MIKDYVSALYVMIGVILYCIINIAHNFMNGTIK